VTPERWSKVREVFDAAVALEPARRAAFLNEACAGDSVLRREVESLLASAEGTPSSFLESPPIDASSDSGLGQTSARSGRLARGSRLGPYEIIGLLGAGGMGEVYQARDPRLARDVAVKVLPASLSTDRDRLRRFEQEAKAAGVLNHPNITAVYDIGQHNGAPYA